MNSRPFYEDISNRIGKKRYEHSLRVAEECVRNDYEKLYSLAKEYDFVITDTMKLAPKVIHSFLGAEIAKKSYGVIDEEVLDAIRYHTTGRSSMTDLEKVVFIADYIEPKRNFDGVEKARRLAEKDLNRCMYYALNSTAKHIIEKDQYLASDTLFARNYYLLECEDEDLF